MEKRSFHELVMTLLVLMATSLVVNGFKTENCEHQAFASNVKSATICIHNVERTLVDDIFRNVETKGEQKKKMDLESICQIGQPFVSGFVGCVDAFSKACLSTKITDLLNEASSTLQFNCRSKNPLEMIDLTKLTELQTKTVSVVWPTLYEECHHCNGHRCHDMECGMVHGANGTCHHMECHDMESLSLIHI